MQSAPNSPTDPNYDKIISGFALGACTGAVDQGLAIVSASRFRSATESHTTGT